MKNLIFVLMALTLASTAFAKSDLEHVREVKEENRELFLSMEGMNGYGIGSCIKNLGKTKKPKTTEREYCIVVNFADEELMAIATEEYEAPFKIDGVWVYFKYVGNIQPKPGVGVHN